MKKLCVSVLAVVLLFSVLPVLGSAQPVSPVFHEVYQFEDNGEIKETGYYYNDMYFPFDDTLKWAQGFCYRVFDEEQKIAGIIGYDSAVINGDELVIPAEIDGYKIDGFSHGVFMESGFKRCDLSAFPNLSQIMFSRSEIREVILSADTKVIPVQCFAGTKLAKIDLPDSLTEIKFRAFEDGIFEQLTIPQNVEVIGAQAFEGCDNLKEIEFKNGLLTAIGAGSDASQWCFMTKSLEKLTLPESITDIGDFEFMESSVGRHWYVPVKYPDGLTVYGQAGSYAEAWAAEKGLAFESITENTDPVLKYTEDDTYRIDQRIDTSYGTVLYLTRVGMPHGPNPGLKLIRPDGEELDLSGPVPYETVHYKKPEHENIVLSEDGRELTFSVSFDKRLVYTPGSIPQVFHDAGVYYFKTDLESGITIETRFEPKDTMGEDAISAWAKPEVERAIELGIVPVSFRENYKRNITRSEFAKLGIYFLSVQYGYGGEGMIQTWSPQGDGDKLYPAQFMNAYCSVRTDRNGNKFKDANSGEDYIYHNTNVENTLADTPFTDVDQNNIKHNSDFVKRAYHMGIVNGVSETAFNPEGDITRQEAAAMLMRIYKNYAQYDSAGSGFEFSDDGEIADWAKEDVYAINRLGIMQGVGEGMFAPLENYTIEQAITTFRRLYDMAPVSRKNKNITPLLDYKFESEQYFHREGGSYFHETQREEYEDFIAVYGYWTMRHTTSTYETLTVFNRHGGILCDRSGVAEWDVSEDEKTLTVVSYIGDTFHMYNRLCGTEKVYDKGHYKWVYDIQKGEMVDFERVS